MPPFLFVNDGLQQKHEVAAVVKHVNHATLCVKLLLNFTAAGLLQVAALAAAEESHSQPRPIQGPIATALIVESPDAMAEHEVTPFSIHVGPTWFWSKWLMGTFGALHSQR